jgi:hypothetical protein
MNPYASYLGDRDPVEVIAATPGELRRIFQTLGDERIDAAPAPGKWSPREILCHLADCEVVFAFRLRQGVAQDHHVIQPFDQTRWGDNYGSYQASDAMAVFTSVRQWNLAFVKGLDADNLRKVLNHPERGDMTLQTVLETMGGHDINHLQQLANFTDSLHQSA